MKATRIELQESRVVQRRNLLKKFAKAWGERDIDTVMACMTTNCVYEASVGPEPGTTFQGADQVRRGILQMFAHVRLEFPICS
jgi:ketosteroid isomerase-like protein